MENVLLVFPYELENNEDYNNIIKNFDEKGYFVHIFNNFDIKNSRINILYNVLLEIKEQYKNLNKIVVLSNVRQFLFSWYRCYNSLFDSFIFFIDERKNDVFLSAESEIKEQLSTFKNIENEIVEGRIYLNLSFYKLLNKYSSLVRYSSYFDILSNFNFYDKSQKRRLNKAYIYENKEIFFQNFENSCFMEKINITSEENFIKNEINKEVNKGKKLIFFKGQSQYDVLRYYIDKLSEEFANFGYDVNIIDFLDKNWITKLNEILKNKCDFAISFNNIGAELKIGNNLNLFDQLNIKFISIIVDPFCYHIERIKYKINNIIYIAADLSDVEFMKKYFPFKRCIFIPLNGFRSGNFIGNKSTREIDVIFAGSIKEPQSIIQSWHNLNNDIFEILNYMAQYIIKYDTIINDETNINKIAYKYNYNKLDLISYLQTQIILFIRNYRRYELVKVICDSNLSIHVFGKSDVYEKLNKNHNLLIHNPVNFNELLKNMTNSKIVLNISAQASYGVSERHISAMLNGAVAVTDRNNFIEKNFMNGKECILYNRIDLGEVNDILNKLITQKDLLDVISKNGEIKAEKDFSITTFVRKLIDTCGI